MKAKEVIALFILFFIFKETMLSIYKAVGYIYMQILASSLPNKITGDLFHYWEVKDKSNLFQSKTLFHAWAILALYFP